MEEQILFEEKVMWYKKSLQAFPGKLTITDKKISFNQDHIMTPGTGLLGFLVSKKAKHTRGGELMSHDLSAVKFAKGKAMGKKSFMLEVETPAGENFRFLFDDAWLSKVDSVIKL